MIIWKALMPVSYTHLDDVIRLREEISRQYQALKDMKKMAASYGYDISQPAKTAKEAVQWLYFGYLAAVKTQKGAAMSVGRISTFLDIYIKRDLDKGILNESQAQELIDHMVMKFRMVKFARIPSYNQLFSGDQMCIRDSTGGVSVGIFTGCLVMSLAETLKALPTFSRRIRLSVGLPWLIAAIAAGKCGGSILYFWKRMAAG